MQYLLPKVPAYMKASALTCILHTCGTLPAALVSRAAMTVMNPLLLRPSSETAIVHLSPSLSLKRKLLMCCIACSVEEETIPHNVGESSSMPANVSDRKRT